jgi:tRNA threonylcarbamoyladenosine biosynthesis protein TsaB
LGTIEEVMKKIKDQPVLFIGDGIPLYKKQIQQFKGKQFHFSCSVYPFPRSIVVGTIAMNHFRKGKTESAETLAPQYLYSRYCAIKGNR